MSIKNNCTFIGNFVSDADLKYTSGGTAVCDFTIAVSEYRKDKPEDPYVVFVKCKAWSQGAELIAKLGKKGSQIVVDASYKQEKYEKDGEPKRYEYFRVNSFEFLRIKKSEEQNDNTTQQQEDDDAPF